MTSTHLLVYLGIHALSTIGVLVAFALRMENRITRLETKMEYLEKCVDK